MEKYLEVFLERLPHQSLFENVEIFLDLNEPNTNELKIVKKYQKMYGSRLNVHVAKKVDPIGASMNRCINQSKGDFLAIWNVDDLRTHNSLEQQLKTFEEFPNSALVYGPYKVVNEFNSEKGRLVDNQRLSPQKF